MRQEYPLVSVVIPAYNAEKTIERCINSCLNQNYSNIQIIVINDGSTDATIDVLNYFSDERLLILTTKNFGASRARSEGIKISSGQFLFFLDSDDYLEDEAIYSLINKQNQNDYDIVIGQAYIHNYSNKKTITDFKLNNANIIDDFLEGLLPVTLWPTLYRNSIFEELNSDKNLTIGEDFVLNAEIIGKNYSYTILDLPIYNYIKHELSITHCLDEKKLEDNYKAFKLGIDILSKSKIPAMHSSLYTFYIKYITSLMINNSPYLINVINKLTKEHWYKEVEVKKKINIIQLLMEIYKVNPYLCRTILRIVNNNYRFKRYVFKMKAMFVNKFK
ncbi:TPA: glycosyltransferase family 2 protein [Photobacterium damselae]